MATALGRVCMLLVLIAATISPVASTATCQSPLIFIDIHDRPVTGHENLLRYGLWIGMGTPAQNDSLWPAITQNETIFAATDFCGPYSAPTCAQNSRGFISTNMSESWHDDDNYRMADHAPVFDGTSAKTGRDTLVIRTQPNDPGPPLDMTLEHFPVMVLSNYSSRVDPINGPAGVFGLGPASKALNHMFDENLITSKSYGLYMGPKLHNAGQSERGSLVLGGYDAGRFRYPLVEYQQSPPRAENAYSPFKVAVTQVSLLPTSGQAMTLLSNSSFDAFITTSQSPVRFPRDVTLALAKALGANATRSEDGTLQVEEPFDGSLSITLDGQLTLVFDSSWLVDAAGNTPISADPLDGNELTNLTESALDKASLSAILGAAFLTQAYMFVNYDAKPPSFSLAQALPNIQDVVPQPFCPGVVPVPVSQSVSSSGGRVSRRVLVGAIVGSIIGLIVLPVLIWAFLAKKLPGQRKGVDMPPHQPLIGDDLSQDEKHGSSMSYSRYHLDAINESAVPGKHRYNALSEGNHSQPRSLTMFATQNLTGKRRRSTASPNSRRAGFRVRASNATDGRYNYRFCATPLSEDAEIASTRLLGTPVPVSSYSRLYQDHRDEREQSPPRYEFSDSVSAISWGPVDGSVDKSLPTTPATSSRQSVYSTSESLVFFSLEQPPPVPDVHATSAKQTPLSRVPSTLLPSPNITVPIPVYPSASRAAFLRSSYHPSTFSVPSLRSVPSLPTMSPPGYSPPTTPTSVSTWNWSIWRSRSQSTSRPKSTLTMTSRSSELASSHDDMSKPLTAVATAAQLRHFTSSRSQSSNSNSIREIVIHTKKALRSKSRGRTRDRILAQGLVGCRNEEESTGLIARAKVLSQETRERLKTDTDLVNSTPFQKADNSQAPSLLAVPIEALRWSSTGLEQALSEIGADTEPQRLPVGPDKVTDDGFPDISRALGSSKGAGAPNEAGFFPDLKSSPASSPESYLSASAYASVYGRMPTPMLRTQSGLPVDLSPGAPPVPDLPAIREAVPTAKPL